MWAACSPSPPAVVVSDCRFVVDGIAERRQRRAALLGFQEGDICGLLPADPTAVVWVPAHLSWPQARLREVLCLDWLGEVSG